MEDDEAFNIQPQERADLLSELGDAIHRDTVKASLWACLQVCDISKLRALVAAARNEPELFSLIDDTCLSVPLRWMQRPPHDSASTSSLSSSMSSAHRGRRSRPKRPKTLAKERDQYSCVLTKGKLHEVAHISPHCMINERPLTNFEASIPSFWKLLNFFFEPDRLNRWHAEIFNDPTNSTKGADGCHNMICLSPTAHSLWSRGMFALRPISMSDDHKELLVQFFWQPRPPHSCFDSVSILESPGSSRGLDEVEGTSLRNPANRNSIKSGDTFVLRTTNAVTHPLPSVELLEMQWHLQRIVSMSGAAEIYDEDDDDDDDNGHQDARAVHNKSFSDILAWVPPPLSHPISNNNEPNSSPSPADFLSSSFLLFQGKVERHENAGISPCL